MGNSVVFPVQPLSRKPSLTIVLNDALRLTVKPHETGPFTKNLLYTPFPAKSFTRVRASHRLTLLVEYFLLPFVHIPAPGPLGRLFPLEKPHPVPLDQEIDKARIFRLPCPGFQEKTR